MGNDQNNWKINTEDLFVEKLNDSHTQIISLFESHDKDLVDFLNKDALINQEKKVSVTYLFFYKRTKEVVGYITLLADAISLSGDLKDSLRRDNINYKSLPALKIGRMCVTESYLRRGIGTSMLDFAIVLAEKISENVGLRFLTIDAKRSSVNFYKKLGFLTLKKREKGTIPMYKDLFKK